MAVPSKAQVTLTRGPRRLWSIRPRSPGSRVQTHHHAPTNMRARAARYRVMEGGTEKKLITRGHPKKFPRWSPSPPAEPRLCAFVAEQIFSNLSRPLGATIKEVFQPHASHQWSPQARSTESVVLRKWAAGKMRA